MSTNADIRAALLKGVIDCALGLPTAWENLPFDDKPNGAPWAAVYVVPSDKGVRVATLGENGEDEHVGIMQVDLNYPIRRGEGDQLAKVDQVAAFFTAGKHLAYGAADVTVQRSYRSKGREVEGMWRVSVTIDWNARVTRSLAAGGFPDMAAQFASNL